MLTVAWLDALRGAPSPRRAGLALVGVAGLLFAVVFVPRLMTSEPSADVLVLLCLPVALLAASFGRTAGVAAAGLGIAVTGLWDGLGGDVGGPLGYLSRGSAFLLLGFLTGWLSERLLAVQQALRDTQVDAQATGERLSAIFAAMRDAVTVGAAVRDGSGRIVDFRLEYANEAAAALYGVPAVDLVGRCWLDLWQGSVDDAAFGAFARLVETGEPVELVELVDQEYRAAGAVGTVSGLIDYRASRFGDGFVATWRDVSDRHRAHLALAAASSQFGAAFDHAPVGMVLLDAERTVLRANAAFAAIVGRELGALTGVSLDALLDPRDVVGSRADFARLLSGEEPVYHRERRLVTARGEPRWVSVSVGRVDGADGVYAVEHFEDIHERKGYEGRLQHLADHDALTGLFNRRRFREELAHQMALDQRYGQSSTVVLLDLDNFKYINDTLGHPTGDRLLQVIAEALRGRLRDSDVIGRLGGDEFAVLLPETDELKAAMVTASLLVGISESEVEHAGQRVRSTGSAGVARIDVTLSVDPDEVLSNADLAMYAAKEAGRNTYVVYDQDGPHAERSRARFRWLDRVRHALENGLFTLLAEPILDLDAGEITGCELLLRMREGRALVEPVEFLAIAERHGLASTIDRFVIGHAIELVASTPRPRGFRWEINLSADSLTDPDIPGLIERTLAENGVSPEALVFEITETAAITSMEQALAFAQRLSDIGCQFALDDFGAGYGSFYYLKHLPFEYLKIDGEFIRELASSPTDQVIVQAIVSAAHQLGKQTIAEYVGDDATLDLLRSYGVDHAQGHHIGRPADPALPLVTAR